MDVIVQRATCGVSCASGDLLFSTGAAAAGNTEGESLQLGIHHQGQQERSRLLLEVVLLLMEM